MNIGRAFIYMGVAAGFLLVSGIGCPAVPADPAPETPAMALTENEAPAKFERIDQTGLRNPFWPIGYTPNPTEAPHPDMPDMPVRQPDKEPQWDEAMKKLDIRGIMKLGTEHVATINGQIAKKGDIIALVYDGNRYRWRVRAIRGDGKISLKPVDVMTPTDILEEEEPDVPDPMSGIRPSNPMNPFGQ
ncbi:MAG: hypothetical protein EOM20_09435 [Spartobacteria bacterium]|nr:hypothetical protein [Spartobacteria bacterium]